MGNSRKGRMQQELENLAAAIVEFECVDIGYPKSLHYICPQLRSAAEVTEVLSALGISPRSRLHELYRLCDGIELPNVENAYSVHTLDMLRRVKSMDSEPVSFEGGEIHFFAGDGGGGRFVVTQKTDQVYFLPVGEVTPERKYTGDETELVARTVDEWIGQLAQRVKDYAYED